MDMQLRAAWDKNRDHETEWKCKAVFDSVLLDEVIVMLVDEYDAETIRNQIMKRLGAK